VISAAEDIGKSESRAGERMSWGGLKSTTRAYVLIPSGIAADNFHSERDNGVGTQTLRGIDLCHHLSKICRSKFCRGRIQRRVRLFFSTSGKACLKTPSLSYTKAA